MCFHLASNGSLSNSKYISNVARSSQLTPSNDKITKQSNGEYWLDPKKQGNVLHSTHRVNARENVSRWHDWVASVGVWP